MKPTASFHRERSTDLVVTFSWSFGRWSCSMLLLVATSTCPGGISSPRHIARVRRGPAATGPALQRTSAETQQEAGAPAERSRWQRVGHCSCLAGKTHGQSKKPLSPALRKSSGHPGNSNKNHSIKNIWTHCKGSESARGGGLSERNRNNSVRAHLRTAPGQRPSARAWQQMPNASRMTCQSHWNIHAAASGHGRCPKQGRCEDAPTR